MGRRALLRSPPTWGLGKGSLLRAALWYHHHPERAPLLRRLFPPGGIDVRLILLCGGSGKRLWPLSNDIRSKPFVKLLPAEHGEKESMIQRVCRMLRDAGLLARTTIVAHRSHAGAVRHHVGDAVPVLAEPCRRGTFTAVALAAAALSSDAQVDPDETLCVLPADCYAEPAFFAAVGRLPALLARSRAELAMIGVAPDHPSSQYGYIVPKGEGGDGYDFVSRFAEKPDEQAAARLIARGALWNCGVFAFSLSFMLSRMADKGVPVRFEELLDRYAELPERSFDVEVAEKTRSRIVITYRGVWRDLGDWKQLAEAAGGRVVGLGHVSDDSRGTRLINELDVPVRVIGIPNAIVAAGPDGVLVAEKEQSHRIKEELAARPLPPTFAMTAETSWGKYRVLDRTDSVPQTVTRKVVMNPGAHTTYHRHRQRSEICTVLSGDGEWILDGALRPIRAGDVLHIPRGANHAVRAASALALIEVQIGDELAPDDEQVIFSSWEAAIRGATENGG